MIKIGIIGGAGYTAGELLRLLLWHPEAEIVFVQSSSHKGQAITKVHKDLLGECSLNFSEADFAAVDVVFLCSGHGQSKSFFEQNNLPENLKVIDLSMDFRLESDHHDFVYGLPEMNKAAISGAKYIANPGCFATAIELALLPLAKEQALKGEVHVTAITGSTGAGQAATDTSHFSWKNNNVSLYKAFDHQHLAEIKESLCNLQNSFNKAVNFIPVRGNFSRGILASVYTTCEWSLIEAMVHYQNYYLEHPFVVISDENTDVKQAVNTNKCILHLEKHGDKLLIVSIIDNLLKGASGQAVQNMNIMFGLAEDAGLRLKPVAF
ncbi:N-acetyl-gamma-glutamyl-phosphate reductase [Ancylomarina euxinus]|uniref:N-acetyl-gamma-glutamyl-phosphate reductase n=1 Tax=Ancylomarina euxinus TaxID=2283627 RepID=A0A425Y2D9_9BACT|nr:N-acetyl-gamma-glutamyl-phosphate reductase [Ancylomarina euxinus]MCZ4694921.1 N-acetyl-gamma-glutamyl-phosphate reductase [Ancylomarina euxinus]MUP14787.1 N-acetyl-gamma-glutamyl-phosphate reductase [Ancylomarina euxinus]RRG22132.1 N-acetyl-gamma-glutamyl-phosphate reductase [Ancylomarina euxinus]